MQRPTPILYDADDAAALLGVSRSVIYKLMTQGLLRGVKIGKSRRFTRQELEALVQSLRDGGQA